MKLIGKISRIIIVIMLLIQCKQPYISPYVSPQTGYLVVEGYISGNTPTGITLSRTVKLSSDTTNPQEPGANVQVEGSDNSIYPLTDQGNGFYSSPGILSLNTSLRYRLRVHTRAGGEYLSDYAPYKTAPPIDSISWVENNNGVTIFANAHDDAGNTRYYLWNYDEVWEYRSAESSEYEFVKPDTILFRPLRDQVYRCWHEGSSRDILINTTAKLSKDIVQAMPLRAIAPDAEQLGVLYSILVRQYALTDSGYNYLALMQKNNESLGTIFDPQPTQLNGGNIHCLSHSGEPVVGFISAGAIQQQRIFIYRSQIPDWTYAATKCPIKDTILPNTPKSMADNYAAGVFTPLYQSLAPGVFVANYSFCVDCTKLGGSNVAPSFWPN